MKQKSLMIYHSRFCEIGGVETFLYNFVINLWEYYDITILYDTGHFTQMRRIAPYVTLEHYDKSKKYECDIFIRNSVWGNVPINVVSRDNRYLEMRHANYKYLKDNKILEAQYKPFFRTNEVIGCGYFVSKMSNKVLKDNPTTIQNILAPTKKTNKVLHLISCTRIDPDKGGWRMARLCEMLREAGIKFDWKIFTNGIHAVEGEEIQYYEPRFDIFDYLADADYTVLLSDVEGLPYTVQESIQYKTPCIVTDIEGCTELIKDGVNGYVVPLDMKFNVKKLLKIPVLKDYDNHAKEKWLDYLGGGKYMKKAEKKEELKLIKMEAIATDEYDRYGEIIKLTPKNNKLLGWIIEGDTLEVTPELAEDLEKRNLAKRIDG